MLNKFKAEMEKREFVQKDEREELLDIMCFGMYSRDAFGRDFIEFFDKSEEYMYFMGNKEMLERKGLAIQPHEQERGSIYDDTLVIWHSVRVYK